MLLLPIMLSYVLPVIFLKCILQNNDAVCSSPHQNPRQVLVSEKLPFPLLQGKHRSHPLTSCLLRWTCFPGANPHPACVYTPLRKMFSPPSVVSGCVLGHHLSHSPGVRLPVRAGAVQVAPLAPPADGEAAHHLGIQNPLPGCPLPSGRG